MTIPRLIPGIPYGPLPKVAAVSGALAVPPKLVVIHDTGHLSNGSTGSIVPAAAEAQYAATRTDDQSRWTSCHAYVDAGGPLGSAPLDVVAWAAFNYANHHGWHIEMCGMNTGQYGAVPAATIGHTARLTAQLCDLAGIPKVKLSPSDIASLSDSTRTTGGVCGHYDVTIGLGAGDHDDPGPRFDWPAFIALVNGGTETDMQQTDKLVHPTPNAPGRDVGSTLTDMGNLRDFLIGAGQLVPGDPSYPTAGSPLGRLLAFLDHAPVVPVALTDADRTAIAAQLAQLVNDAVAQLVDAKLDAILERLAAAGGALNPPTA